MDDAQMSRNAAEIVTLPMTDLVGFVLICAW
jgi:hypothetical protein